MNKPLGGFQLNFDQSNLLLLNIALAIIMFGVALDLNKESFKQVVINPKGVVTGLVSQFILLPAFTFLFIWLVEPLPGLAMGMLLVAACPGGNVSNFFSTLSKGNVALSVSLTIVASLAAVIMTPLNFQFWGGWLNLGGLVDIEVDFFGIMKTIAMIIIMPLFAGLVLASRFPKSAGIISKPLRYISFVILITIIGLAFFANFDMFLAYYDYVIYLVFFHNALAFAIGYYFSKALGNSAVDQITISIETGIQNSGLGLVIIFTFFDGNGAMAIITAWWGIWHIFSGSIVSQWFAYTNSKLNKVIIVE